MIPAQRQAMIRDVRVCRMDDAPAIRKPAIARVALADGNPAAVDRRKRPSMPAAAPSRRPR